MTRLLAFALAFTSVMSVALAAEEPRSNVDLPRSPSVSPDGSMIAFTWRGDIWKVSSKGGFAERLTSNPFDDTQSAWSRDGKRIAFSSNRLGGINLFIMNADGTGIRQVTQTDRATGLVAFGTDDAGHEVLTASAMLEHDAYRSPRPYMVRTDGTGADLVRVFDAYGSTPAVSPNGKRVLFQRGTTGWNRRGYRGPDARDVWLYERGDKSYKKLTTWNGNDGKGKWIDDEDFVYASDRNDNTVNLYRLRAGAEESSARRLTNYADIDVDDFDIAADGRSLVFSRWNRLYTLDLTHLNAQPIELSILAAEDESDRFQLKDVSKSITEAALSPDGKTMAYIAYGDVYVRGTEPKSSTHRVTVKPSRERDLAWSADSEKLYFTSDDGGNEAIYSASVKLTRSDVKKQYEAATKKNPETRPTTRPATGPSADETAAPASNEPASNEPGGNEPAGKGDLEATADQARRRGPGGAAGGDTPTTGPSGARGGAGAGAADSEPSRWAESLTYTIELVSKSDVGDTQPSPSPDGKWLALKRGKGDLFVMSLDEKAKDKSAHALLNAWSEQLDWRWSPDSRYIAYQTEDESHNSDIWIVKSDDHADAKLSGRAKSAMNVTRHPDNDFDPRWSADGKILAFRSERVNNEFDVWMVYLDKDLEGLPAVELDQYYKDAAASAKKRQPLKATTRPATQPASKPTSRASATTREGDDDATTSAARSTTTQASEAADDAEDGSRPARRRTARGAATQPTEPPKPLDLDDAYLRLRRITSISGDEQNLEIAPAGDKFYFTASAGWVRSVYVMERDATEPKRLAAAVGVQGISMAGDALVFVDNPTPLSPSRRAGTIKLPSGEQEYLDISSRVRLDLSAMNLQKFNEAARILGTQYWDETMHGLDWRAVTAKYAELARATRTADEFDFVANKLIGELNGSHLGINAPDAPNPQARTFGRLGAEAKRDAERGYTITAILPDSPADRGKMKLKIGDCITAIDGEPFDFKASPPDTLEGKLASKSDQEVLLSFTRDGHDLATLITPTTFERIGDLTYNNWRRENARKVEEWSGGKLGYIHILAMSQPALDIFERDLYAAAQGKQGLIIDVRNNGGGSTADRLLGSIMYPRHAYTIPRGMDGTIKDGYPQDRLFIQRYDKPIDMLCNEKSFSNAEIISHAFKTLKRGTLVGQQTAGGVISTGGTTLLDGTSVRIPGRAWYLPDGTNMEMHGAMPDIVVEQTPADEVKGEDAQLRAAVEDLMKRAK